MKCHEFADIVTVTTYKITPKWPILCRVGR